MIWKEREDGGRQGGRLTESTGMVRSKEKSE